MRKMCPRCGIQKELTEFGKDNYRRDGLASKCKACTNAAVRASAIKHGRINPNRTPGRPKIKAPPAPITCDLCGKAKGKEKWWGSRCPDCRTEGRRANQEKRGVRAKERRQEIKRLLVKQLGGECVHCGYNRYIAGLSLHHVKGKDEAIGLLLDRASTGGAGSMARLLKEVEKCILLCFNCHMALHAGEWRID